MASRVRHLGMTALPDAARALLPEQLPNGDASRTMPAVGKKRRDAEDPVARRQKLREKAARSRANRRIGFFGHALVWALTVLLLSVVAGAFTGLVVALAWGILLALHGFFWIVAPTLKRRWVDAELGPRVQRAVVDERRLVSGRQTRAFEATTAQLAHEIRNPITAAKSLVQQIAEDPASPDSVEYARVAVEELDRVERSIAHVLKFAREEPVALEAMTLGDAVETALTTLEPRLREADVRVERDGDGREQLLGDPDKIRRIVINLVGNAVEAIADGGATSRRVRVSTGESLDGSEVWLSVEDDGPGIESERLEKIFTPFYTSKRDGTGLGLAITKKLVDAHGGNIEVDSRLGSGTTFSVHFPKLGRDPAEDDA